MEIKNNLRQLVAKTGMKHSFLSDKVGVSDTAFSYWINNHRQPGGVYTQRLQKILGCDEIDIFNDDSWEFNNGN